MRYLALLVAALLLGASAGQAQSITEIFKDEKFSETTVAASRNVPNYYSVVFVTDAKTQVSHYAKAYRELYTNESQRLLLEFLRVSLDNFYDNVVK